MERFFVHQLSHLAFRRFRPARLKRFYEWFRIDASTRILDLGGTPYFWQLAGEIGLPAPAVTVLNLVPPAEPPPPGIRWVIGDAIKLPFQDSSFDVVFCNSLIEHLYTREAQQQLAGEIRRVASRYFVQTPSRYFPVEQHLMGLGVHWAPRSMRPALMRWTTLAGLTAKFDMQHCRDFSRELKLLGRRDLLALFPGSRIVVERFCGWEKSLIAVQD
ncbi:MAG: class I SAM-dependent methyltransferase [Bryobacterales bacterium]|nr:class I SAM-dependent methyltransferase [Bryobacterales bacterium]